MKRVARTAATLPVAGFLSFLVLASLAGTEPALAGPGQKSPHRIPRVTTPIRVDGVLDEEAWGKALVLELDYEVSPGENIPPPVKTELLLAYDTTHLFAGFRAYDPDPRSIRARFTDRDGMFEDDWVALILDTFNDERRSFDFFCNPLGIQGDSVESPEGGGGEWDAIWDSAGRITEFGYVVEIAIPFNSLRFQPGGQDQIWGFDAVRNYPRDVQHTIGLFPRDRNNTCYLCQADKLIGFAGVTPGHNLELDPTFAAVLTQVREAFADGSLAGQHRKLDPGVTAQWGLRPNLALSATANPDFSQVEADAVQLDVNTAFALYYPEKRPFFLEGADFFQTLLQTVYTRTLADPDWGFKLTGKEGRNVVGLFAVRDGVTNLLFPGPESSASGSLEEKSTAAVLRYRRDIGQSSTLGFLATDREAGQYYNRMVGLDGDLNMTAVDRLRFQILGSRTHYPRLVQLEFGQPEGDFAGSALDVEYSHNARNVNWFTGYRRVSAEFRADVGFMPQAGFRIANAGGHYTWWRNPGHWFTQIQAGLSAQDEQGPHGQLLTRACNTWVYYAGPLQSFLYLEGALGRRGYNESEFENRYVDLDVGLRPNRRVYIESFIFYGDGIDYANTRQGRSFRIDPYIELRPDRHLFVGFGHTFERFTVDPGRLFTANLSRLKLIYQFSPHAFVRSVLQYVDYNYNAGLYTVPPDPRYRHLANQLLFSYKLNPQTVLFIGYSDDYFGDSERCLTQGERTFFTKIGYALRL